MDWEDALAHAARSIHAGGKEALHSPPFLPCGSETHEPFRLMEQPIGMPIVEAGTSGDLAIWGVVSTSSWQFSGERTDLHDVWSLCWAAFLRATGIASPWLVDEEGWCGPMELAGRHLFIQPVSGRLQDKSAFNRAFKSLSAWTSFAFHLLDAVFDWEKAANDQNGTVWLDEERLEDWVQPVLKSLHNPKQYTGSKRIAPSWTYFSALPSGVSIVRFSRQDMRTLKFVLGTYRAKEVAGDRALAVFANGIANGVPFKSIKLAKRLMKRCGDAEEKPLILPIDSHCIFLGAETLIAIRENCGQKVYEEERRLFLERRAHEDNVFFADSQIDWLLPLDAGCFEDLCVDILSREPGVVRAKPVGGVNEPDGGRDIVVDWIVASHQPGAHQPKPQRKRILVQVKTRRRSVGKGDVKDVRDMLELHEAQGYLLIAHPRVSGPLVRYLEHLQDGQGFLVDWWEMRDVESRLRSNPDIARRHRNLVRLSVG